MHGVARRRVRVREAHLQADEAAQSAWPIDLDRRYGGERWGGGALVGRGNTKGIAENGKDASDMISYRREGS